MKLLSILWTLISPKQFGGLTTNFPKMFSNIYNRYKYKNKNWIFWNSLPTPKLICLYTKALNTIIFFNFLFYNFIFYIYFFISIPVFFLHNQHLSPHVFFLFQREYPHDLKLI